MCTVHLRCWLLTFQHRRTVHWVLYIDWCLVHVTFQLLSHWQNKNIILQLIKQLEQTHLKCRMSIGLGWRGEVKINRCVKECGKQTFCFALKWLCSLSLSSHTTDLMYLFFLSCTKHVFQQETFYRQCIHSYSHNHAFVCLCIFVSNIA